MTTLIVLTIISYFLTLVLRVVLDDAYQEMRQPMKILALIPGGSILIIIGFIIWAIKFKK